MSGTLNAVVLPPTLDNRVLCPFGLAHSFPIKIREFFPHSVPLVGRIGLYRDASAL
jgi:hypothetical protein